MNYTFSIFDKLFINVKSSKSKWMNWFLWLFTIILLVLIFITIGLKYMSTHRPHLSCNICGNNFTYQTWMGDFYGNHCNNGSFGDRIEDCGVDSSCFKMNTMISPDFLILLKRTTEYYKNNSHHWQDHFLFDEGTVRGCIKGFGRLDGCHFVNTSYLWGNRTSKYWRASNMCVCNTNSCN